MARRPGKSVPAQGLLPGTPRDPDGPDAGWGHENLAWRADHRHVAGLDEVGRGALAGPVVVAAVIFPRGTRLEGLRDSKALSPRRREKLACLIRDSALSWSLGVAEAAEVDRLNVLEATLAAMRQAVDALSPRPDLLLLDAVHLPGSDVPQRRLVKGDRLCASIAAASILAKVERDRRMVEFDRIYTYYRFGENKGYGTTAHLQALESHGPCSIHRRTFRRVRGPEDKPGPLLA
jgi:ribonuclease HII